ncbi:unnamed protein product [Amoebophrya sp. A120]|nr:unnamed protein product [Amoebophrya sp. A120]|eukprot:GSA120T00018692001.1
MKLRVSRRDPRTLHVEEVLRSRPTEWVTGPRGPRESARVIQERILKELKREQKRHRGKKSHLFGPGLDQVLALLTPNRSSANLGTASSTTGGQEKSPAVSSSPGGGAATVEHITGSSSRLSAPGYHRTNASNSAATLKFSPKTLQVQTSMSSFLKRKEETASSTAGAGAAPSLVKATGVGLVAAPSSSETAANTSRVGVISGAPGAASSLSTTTSVVVATEPPAATSPSQAANKAELLQLLSSKDNSSKDRSANGSKASSSGVSHSYQAKNSPAGSPTSAANSMRRSPRVSAISTQNSFKSDEQPPVLTPKMFEYANLELGLDTTTGMTFINTKALSSVAGTTSSASGATTTLPAVQTPKGGSQRHSFNSSCSKRDMIAPTVVAPPLLLETKSVAVVKPVAVPSSSQRISAKGDGAGAVVGKKTMNLVPENNSTTSSPCNNITSSASAVEIRSVNSSVAENKLLGVERNKLESNQTRDHLKSSASATLAETGPASTSPGEQGCKRSGAERSRRGSAIIGSSQPLSTGPRRGSVNLNTGNNNKASSAQLSNLAPVEKDDSIFIYHSPSGEKSEEMRLLEQIPSRRPSRILPEFELEALTERREEAENKGSSPAPHKEVLGNNSVEGTSKASASNAGAPAVQQATGCSQKLPSPAAPKPVRINPFEAKFQKFEADAERIRRKLSALQDNDKQEEPEEEEDDASEEQ